MSTQPTYVVQVSPFAWLDANGTITTVSAHAAQFALIDANVKHAALGSRAVREAAVGSAKGQWRSYLLTAPVAVVPYAAFAERVAANARAEGGRPAPAPEGQAAGGKGQASEPAAPKPKGITTLIREWVAANPQATKAEAYAQFPDANRSTVNVQFGVARKG